jgi:hypothetical protein
MRAGAGNVSDLAGAALLIAIGGFGAVLASDLPMRSGPRLGPGAMPLGASLLVMGMGLVVALRGFLVSEPPPGGWRLRPMLAVSGAIVAFALTVERAGLVAASALLLALAVAAQPRPRWIESGLYIVALTAATAALFKLVLKQPLSLWPW